MSSSIYGQKKVTHESILKRSDQLEREALDDNYRLTDRLFVWLMVVQWIGGIITAAFVSPYTWIGQESLVNFHVWLAIFLGGALSSAPILLGVFYPGRAITRHVIAISQALWGALLIHLSGGRVETHFHVFCSLAFIAFYRDWKVLITMTVVVAVDHAVRGVFFPLSVYGVVLESPLRWIEHAAWVVAEDFVLVWACLRSRREARAVCENQAELENARQEVEVRIEERTRELKEKTAEAEQFALVAKHTSNSVLILDANGHVESVNDAFTRITGYTLEEVVGQLPIDVLGGPTTKPEERSKLEEGLASQKPFDLVAHKHRKNGDQMILAIEARPIFDGEGKLVRYFQIESDITARTNAERDRERLASELQNAARQAGMAELASDVLHSVGNALNSINVSAQSLRQKIESKSVAHLSKAANLISKQGSHLSEFLSQDNRGQQFPTFLNELALALSGERKSQLEELSELSEKIEHVKEIVASQSAFTHCRVPCEPVAPNELIETAVRMSESSIEGHEIEIVNSGNEMPDLLMEKHTVIQILIHLIKNAKESVREFQCRNPEIRISVERKNDEVSFVVADNGGGIQEESLIEIFQQGFSTKENGRGFGLHSSANVAQELGGVLLAESDGPGKGAKFTLCLPMREVACSTH